MPSSSALPFSLLLALSVSAFSWACNCPDSCPLPRDPFDPLGPWHQRHLDCGIPPFAYRLPQDAQAKIHAIWVKYQAGDECEEEQEATRAVIMAIPEEIRMQTFKGVCGPGFLKNESDEVREQFMHAWFDESLDVEKKQGEFRRLAKELLKGNSAKRFEQFDQRLSQQIAERAQTIAQMSAPARDAYTKWQTMRKEERLFLASLSADIRAELGLICKCCGSCKSGQKTASAKVRAVRALAFQEAAQLARGLAQSDAHVLAMAASPECA